MSEDPQSVDVPENPSNSHPVVRTWLVITALALLLVAGFGIGFAHRQQVAAEQWKTREAALNSNIGQLQSQVSGLTAQLSDMAAKEKEMEAAAKAPTKNLRTSHPASVAARRPEDPRFKKLQSQLDEQSKQLQAAQADTSKTRSDLEGSIGSTREELNGSIARTHDELVELERKGERNFYEFDLTKAKSFQHAGPIQISLRKADTKHKRFDLAMIVDDNELGKKSVNLYEPIWIHRADDTQPVQIVVNKIDKNHVHGYVSEPRYRQTPASGDSGSTGTFPPVKQD